MCSAGKNYRYVLQQRDFREGLFYGWEDDAINESLVNVFFFNYILTHVILFYWPV